MVRFGLRKLNRLFLPDGQIPVEPRQRNMPVESGIRIAAPVLETFVSDVMSRAGLAAAHTEIVARHLVGNDLRCTYSHGSCQVANYVPLLLAGELDGGAVSTVVQESPASAMIDGGKGLGYEPALLATMQSISRTKGLGVSMAASRNHGHVGGLAPYTTAAAEEGLVSIACTSRPFARTPGASVAATLGTSAFSIAAPGGEAGPFVLDMSSSFLPSDASLLELFPRAFAKSVGLEAALFALGWALLDAPLDGQCDPIAQATQGFVIITIDPDHDGSIDSFESNMSWFADHARTAAPLPGSERVEIPGQMERRRRDTQLRVGIGVGDAHLEKLISTAELVGLDHPFAALEATRF